ncbi:mucolipin-3-like isoform X2 [Dysidea avara]
MIVQFVNNTPDCKHENLHPTIYAPTTECVSNETAECCDNHTIDGGQTTECCCSIKDQVRCCIDEENIGRVSIISFNFTLFASFNEKDIEEYNKVKSFVHFDILLQSDRYSGIFVEVQINRKLIRYHRDNFMTTTTIVDIFVFILLILSSGTYFYSVCLTIKLCKDLKLHFSAFHKKHLRWKEISHLFNKWYILMLFTNTLIFSGTILKIITEYQEEIVIDLLETVRLLLGVGLLLLWCGLFGLLISFEPLNVLFITVSLALPSVLWFLCCVAIIFIAFSLCGWLVLSSYHPKFTTFWLSIESLFTILNGDDLYVTFEEFDSTFLSSTTEVFSKLYLALFIFIFIYIVLSLFIGIFSHAYESLSDDWRKRSRGFLRDWAEGKPNDDPTQSYPFPIPPLRKPVDDTAIEISDDSSAHNMVPVIELTTPNHDDHSAFVRSFNHSLSPRQIKLQVADPPKASRSEVDEARQRLAPTKVVDETEA